jgi:diamine N-acetyltransferase
MILKALQGNSLSSGELKLYGFSEKDEPVGCIELYNYDPINRRAAVGIVISNEYRHRGYGQAMVSALTEFCQQNTSLHQLYADIAATNQPSIRIFSRAGYQHCATLRDWVIRANQFVDTYRYQLILE